MFLDVVGVVGGCEDFGFVDVVYANGFENLAGTSTRIWEVGRVIG